MNMATKKIKILHFADTGRAGERSLAGRMADAGSGSEMLNSIGNGRFFCRYRSQIEKKA